VLPVADDPLECERATPLRAEASARRYARLHGLRHFRVEAAILMRFPTGTAPSEVARVERSTRLLAQAGVPVPALIASDPAAGWILEEDLGDSDLAVAVARGDAGADRYREALELLTRLERLGSLDTSPAPPLDATRLRRELQLFVDSALAGGEAPGRGLLADLERLVRLCAASPTTLCHRDYHARNLMLHQGRLRVIDHQDAMRGPAAYDRVSLAYDPYVELDDALRDALAGEGPDVAAVGVQRLCKAIGTYASKGSRWQASIGPAARQARRLIARSELRLPVLLAALAPLALEAAPRAPRPR
jgi:aminoglycoside/choline kinase family phosphotransferase